MDTSGRKRWLPAMMLVGVVYLVVGVTFGTLAGGAGSSQARGTWRLAAWVASAAAFVAHIAYEHFRLRNTARPASWHVAAAVAFGAFALALVANVHDLGSASGYRPRMLIALVAWPVLTAVPAFVVALAAAAGLGLKRSRD